MTHNVSSSQAPHWRPNPAHNPVRIRRNDWSVLRPPDTATWTPHLTVSIVIPAYGGQEKLDIVLAALAAQDYPEDLTEVIVVDDHSDPALELSRPHPANTTIILSDDANWGSAHAVNSGVRRAEGDIVLRLDADMLVFHDHVSAHMRYHHAADNLVVLGHKRFVDWKPGTFEAQQVTDAVSSGKANELFDTAMSEPHWIEGYISDHDDLRYGTSDLFRVFTGATGSLPRTLYNDVGGFDGDMKLGSDTEFGYRLNQAGAVFIPESNSSSWHLGMGQMKTARKAGQQQRLPFLTQRIPLYRQRRLAPARNWRVPLVDVIVEYRDNMKISQVDKLLAPLLGGSVPDIRVHLINPAEATDTPRGKVLDAKGGHWPLVRELYAAEPRVVLGRTEPDVDPAVPFRLHWHEGRTGLDSIRFLFERMEADRLGLLTTGGAVQVRMERQAAFARARQYEPHDLDSEVNRVWGHANIYTSDFNLCPTVFDPNAGGHDSLPRRAIRRLFSARQRRWLKRNLNRLRGR